MATRFLCVRSPATCPPPAGWTVGPQTSSYLACQQHMTQDTGPPGGQDPPASPPTSQALLRAPRLCDLPTLESPGVKARTSFLPTPCPEGSSRPVALHTPPIVGSPKHGPVAPDSHLLFAHHHLPSNAVFSIQGPRPRAVALYLILLFHNPDPTGRQAPRPSSKHPCPRAPPTHPAVMQEPPGPHSVQSWSRLSEQVRETTSSL